MTTLVSPGVDVQIINEAIYGSAGPGTIPLIVMATRSNKPSPTGVGIAPGTVPSEAGKLYLATSQRELNQTFGNPFFATVQGTPVHGHELNEYGLHAAYQFLGINNAAYVIRADLDLAELEPSVSSPRGAPLSGTYWLDLANTQFGVFQSTGNTSLDPFMKQPVLVVSDAANYNLNTGYPVVDFGEDGDFAVVTIEANNRMFEKIDNVWYLLGSNAWKMVRNVIRGPNPIDNITPGDAFSINGVTVVLTSNSVTQAVLDINTAIANAPSLVNKIIASNDSQGRIAFHFMLDSVELQNVTGNPLAAMQLTSGVTKGVKLTYATHNRVPQGSVFGDVWIKTTATNSGSKMVVKYYDASLATWVLIDAPFYANDATADLAFGANRSAGSIYVQYNVEGTTQYPLAGQQLRIWNGSAWETLVYEQGYEAPTTDPVDGSLWFNTNFQADIMVCDGDQWLGYRRMYPMTDKHGVQIASSAPKTQLDGSPLVDNDLWLDASDLENYPRLYRFQAAARRWVMIDNADQTTPYGIVFADARQDSGPSYTGAAIDYVRNSTSEFDLVLSNYVDPDCVDPRTYSAGTLLFNTRFSTYNVKQWKGDYFGYGGYDANTSFTVDTYTVGLDTVVFPPVASAGRWVTVSGNDVDGTPFMGRKAQRIMVVRALAATISSNQEIRSEMVYYNLLAAPGYPELIDEMITLNVDQKEVSFIVGDTPARLKPSGTDIQRWATNANNAASNGDKGLTAASENVGIYYPWGLSTNVDGTEIMVPPSTIALRTIAYNDQVAYQWFAPAGFTRGLVFNASSVGYLNAEGEYQPVILNQGQRDILYLNKINPIAYIPNRGLVVYGQKTLSPSASALDRVNVARLANYLRYNLDNIAKPFLFQPNDMQTRDAFKATIERFLVGLVGLRAIEDFAVVCDESNNTAERRNRNELWCDMFIAPEKAVEFIYLPVRIRNSGDSLS
jgi:hypothetical protein